MRLLFMGDSLIEFFDWQARFRGHEVHNMGIAGETVEGLLARTADILAGTGAPDMVFIMSGINNLAMDDNGFLEAYGRIIRRIRDRHPSARIFVNSLLPVILPFISNDDIRAVNRELKALAEAEGASYLDVHPLFLKEDGRPDQRLLLDDGVHLSNEGYEVWSALIDKEILQD